MRWSRPMSVAPVLLVACSRSAAPAAPPKPDAAAVAAAPAPDAPAVHVAPYHVAGKEGVVELDADGRVGKTLVATPNASSPRYLPDRKGIVYLADGAVHVLSLVSGRDEKIATLTARAKCHEDGDVTLAVQSREDVSVDAAGAHLCVLLQDRNVNRMSFALSQRVDLATHKVEQKWTTWEPGCEERPTGEALDCPEKPAPPRKEASFPYRYGDRVLVGPGDKIVARLGDFTVDTSDPSPSGRWVLLAGNLETGDSIHRQLLLLDRQTGELRPLGGGTTWPKPLTPKELKHPTREGLGDRAGDFVGESPRWFPSENVLAIDGTLLFLDRQRVVAIPGELAE